MKIPNYNQLRCSIAVAVCACCAGLSAMAQGTTAPYGSVGTVIPNASAQIVTASGADIVATYYHGIANGDHDILYLNGVQLFDNHVDSTGNTVDLGVIAAGTVLSFTMSDLSVGNAWNMGSGAGNADGCVHAYVANGFPAAGSTYIGWEDRSQTQSTDFNYNDLTFTFTNIQPVPEPATMALVALGGASLSLFRRRKA